MLSAAAEEGKSLLELDQVFDSVTAADNLGTIGFSTSGCSLPVGTPGKSRVESSASKSLEPYFLNMFLISIIFSRYFAAAR